MFLFGARRFGRMGPLGLALAGYQLWRRMSPEQKKRVRRHASQVGGRIRNYLTSARRRRGSSRLRRR